MALRIPPPSVWNYYVDACRTKSARSFGRDLAADAAAPLETRIHSFVDFLGGFAVPAAEFSPFHRPGGVIIEQVIGEEDKCELSYSAIYENPLL